MWCIESVTPKICGVGNEDRAAENEQEEESNDGNDDVHAELDTASPVLLLEEREFRPVYTISVWKEPVSRDDRATVAVLLPSGVPESRGGVRVEIEDELVLRITVKWPRVMTDVPRMLRVLIDGSCGTRIDPSHPMVGGFYDALHAVQHEKDAVVESFARIPLPFTVLPRPVKRLCAYQGSAAVVLLVTVEVPASAFADIDELPLFTAKPAALSAVDNASANTTA